ncbi:MAG: hypothetical protein Q9173_003772 [Seirophora scorigena]
MAHVISALFAGGLITATGYFTPFKVISSILVSLGTGFLSTFHPSTGHPEWIGYQALFGLSSSLGMNQALMAAQTVLPLDDVSIGTALVIFAQTLGGAIFVSAAENIFTNISTHDPPALPLFHRPCRRNGRRSDSVDKGHRGPRDECGGGQEGGGGLQRGAGEGVPAGDRFSVFDHAYAVKDRAEECARGGEGSTVAAPLGDRIGEIRVLDSEEFRFDFYTETLEQIPQNRAI